MRVPLAEPQFSTDAFSQRYQEWSKKEADFAQSLQVSIQSPFLLTWDDGQTECPQGRPTARGLLQTTRDIVDEDTECRLTRQELSDLLDEETRTWVVGPTALEGVSGDLGIIINCTRENDIILLRIEDEIRLPDRLVVPWNLTLSAYITSTDLVDGILPATENKVRLRCPEKDGIFYIRSQSVLLANLIFRGCSLDTENASIIEVGACMPDSPPGKIRLHHVTFRRNSLNGASGLSVPRSSCSSVEMIDIIFSDNTCGDRCLARLSLENDLRGLTLRRNVQSSEGRISSSLMSSPSGSSSSVDRLRASSNELSVLHIVEGSLEMSNAEIRTSRQSSLLLDHAQGVAIVNSSFHENFASVSGAAIFSNGTKILTVSNCNFTSNSAESGAAITSFDGNLTINRCFVQDNTATGNAGSLLVSNGKLELLSTVFKDNVAVGNGGAIFLVESPSSRLSQVKCLNNTAGNGGCMQTSRSNDFTLDDSIILKNSATNGGAMHCNDVLESKIVNTSFEGNVAYDKGGAILILASSQMEFRSCTVNNNSAMMGGGLAGDQSKIAILNSSLLSNKATFSGGGADFIGCNVTGDSLTIHNNEGGRHGGGIICRRGTLFNLSDSVMWFNFALDGGGCLYIEMHSQAFLHKSVLENNTATENGGAVFLQDSQASANMSAFRRNAAAVGGSIVMRNSSLQLATSSFSDDKAALSGGSIAADLNNSLTILDTVFSNTEAKNGGSIWLSGSNLTANGCTLSNNRAEEHGGAIAFDSSDPQFLALQLNNCTFTNNSADLGGAVHISTRYRPQGCTDSSASCTSVSVTGSSFSKNQANRAGGAIFTKDPGVLRYSCSSKDTEILSRVYTSDAFKELYVLESTRDTCPEWDGNDADLYGPVIASYARSVKGFTVSTGQADSEEPVKNNQLVSKNYRSGDSLPMFRIDVLDGYGQSPALGEGDAFVQATMYSPNDLFSGEVNMQVNAKRKGFPPISGFQRPGQYEIQIHFSEPGLEALVVKVEVRDCKLGEFAQENGKRCVLCSGSQYNFDPDASVCQPCPENGNCTTDVIHPNRGYWHRTPCSRHVQRCVTREACDFSGREDELNAVTSEMETCSLDKTLDRDYSSAQCKRGYTGLLCGSCDAGYGRSWSSECGKCFRDSTTAMLLVASVFVLVLLSSFVIRSNLNTRLADFGRTNRISRRNPRRAVPEPRGASSSDVPVNFEMVEMLHRGEVPSELIHPDLLFAAEARNRNSTSGSANAKHTLIEIFKIIINFLQVTAAAAIINVNWTAWMRSLLFIADFLSGATNAGIALSVDCLSGASNDPPRSMLRSVIHILIPSGILAFYILFWILLTWKYDENTWYFARRALLSFLAVAYLTYVSITKTSVNTLYCITIHDSTGFANDYTDRYWALDTSVRCYVGSHAVLASIVGWPILIVFSFGLPVMLTYILIKQRSQEPGLRPWLADATGILYRAYKDRFIFWESIVLLRKAILTVVVVFSYPLGANIQGILAVCVLAVAIYIHVICRPFDEPYDFLNTFETASLVVSQLTFASGLFFNDDRTSGATKVLLTLLLSSAICGLFLVLSYAFMKSAEVHLRIVLEEEGRKNVQAWSTLRVLKTFFSAHVIECVRHLLCKQDRRCSIKLEDAVASSDV